MTENKDNKPEIFVSESRAGADHRGELQAAGPKAARKYAIIGLMVLVFMGCLYLIFAPSGEQAPEGQAAKGLNRAVPQAMGADMPADKGKAYEQEMLKQRNEEKRRAVTNLSDYWQQQEQGDSVQEPAEPASRPTGLESYRNAKASLGSFYQNNDESARLKEELAVLRRRMAEQPQRPPNNGIQNQLALMEKSYQMASKYFPGAMGKDSVPQEGTSPEEPFQRVVAAAKGVVSSLTIHGTTGTSEQLRNSVRACVHRDQTITPGVPVQLRLLEPAQVSGTAIPSGSLVSATAKFEVGRLQLAVTSVLCGDEIVQISMAAYDTDGLKGLGIPYNPEANALSQVAGNMASSGGTSIMMTQSAGQQMAADLSRGVVQGISGYFSKKVKMPKVHLPASYEVLLVSKK
ncbi:hypothetical protein D3C87_405680 [compost metagenome]